MNMKQLSLGFIFVLLFSFHGETWAGAWGPTFAIEVRGDAFAEPIVITDPSIVEELSFWVGPGTGFSEFMGPVNHDRSIVDWEHGEASDRPDGLASYEVRFLLEPRANPPVFTIMYEPDLENDSGYIYYPTGKNSIVTHRVDGTWRYASTQWNDKIGEAIAAHLQSHAAK